jgi:uncharacterized protein (DUF2235 family)
MWPLPTFAGYDCRQYYVREAKMKRIVVCCDGTWNDPSKPKQTNVSKLANAVVRRDEPEGDQPAQRVHYVDGVGTKGSLWDQLRGAAVGYGLDANVQIAYRYIAEDYEPGDDIYLFGFSRGAYTARSTLGMVRKCGIVKDTAVDKIAAAWEYYRNGDHPESDAAKAFRAAYARALSTPEDNVPVAKFIGVWDTVGSLGVPIGRLQAKFNFHDVTLTSLVDNAYHALAIDEKRRDYIPTLWARSKTPRKEQELEQCWFSGSHSDVGGGAGFAGDDAQSDHCLRWILDKAMRCGLDVDAGRIAWTPPRQDFPRLHTDPGLIFKLWGLIREPISRPIGQGVPYGQEGYGRPSFETVDQEARRRLHMAPSYQPKNLITWEAEQGA